MRCIWNKGNHCQGFPGGQRPGSWHCCNYVWQVSPQEEACKERWAQSPLWWSNLKTDSSNDKVLKEGHVDPYLVKWFNSTVPTQRGSGKRKCPKCLLLSSHLQPPDTFSHWPNPSANQRARDPGRYSSLRPVCWSTARKRMDLAGLPPHPIKWCCMQMCSLFSLFGQTTSVLFIFSLAFSIWRDFSFPYFHCWIQKSLIRKANL